MGSEEVSWSRGGCGKDARFLLVGPEREVELVVHLVGGQFHQILTRIYAVLPLWLSSLRVVG